MCIWLKLYNKCLRVCVGVFLYMNFICNIYRSILFILFVLLFVPATPFTAATAAHQLPGQADRLIS